MNELIDKIGEIMITYDGILNEFNTTKICTCLIEKNNKIIDLCEIMVEKYKKKLNNQQLNDLILMIFLIYDNHTGPKDKDQCFQNVEKIINEYQEELSNINLKIFMNIILNIYKNK